MQKYVLTAATLALLMAASSQAGLRYKVQTRHEGQKGGPGNQTVQMTAEGDKARIDFLEGGPMDADGYILTRDGGKSMTMVSTKDKTYMNWDMDVMMGMAGAMTSMMKMEVSEPKVEKLLDEPGEPILGYPTRHYKFRINYDMSMTVMGFKNSTSVAREEENWTTTKIDTAALGRWINQSPKTMNESLDKLIRLQRDQMQGLPLKMISVQTTTDKKGKSQVTKQIMEVTEIQEMKVDAATLEIPAGYKEATMEAKEGDEDAPDKKGAAPSLPSLMKMFGK
ncbi:MAG: DUF4412 domain-containing protein [Kiritimatiellia bacterium]